MSNTTYTASGTVTNQLTGVPVADLHVLVYEKDILKKDQFLGIGVTAADGSWQVTFVASQFQNLLDRRPDLYFIVKDAGYQLYSSEESPIKNAGQNTVQDIQVDLSNDLLRNLIVPTPIPWVGGYYEKNKEKFQYPTPDLSGIPVTKNLDNIPKIQRQQKVVWPEFSWVSPEGRCYQMFAPDISRLGYDATGRVWAIICPQQGTTIPGLGSMNVEVTVTGVRGWVDEPNKSLAADMSVIGQVWFSGAANESPLLKALGEAFFKKGLNFPFNKANAIQIHTSNPKDPSEVLFPLTNGQTDEFEIPVFAQHKSVSWHVAHLGVLIGDIITKEGEDERVIKFNQTILNLFNLASGNMLKSGNTLTWNVWFTEPETVNTDDWTGHAERWRDSIDADHGSPEGPGTDPRFMDGTPFSPLDNIFEEGIKELEKILGSL